MPNAVKTTKKKIFKKDQVKVLEKNGNLSRNYLVRPLASESTKNFNHSGVFFLSRNNYQKLKKARGKI